MLRESSDAPFSRTLVATIDEVAIGAGVVFASSLHPQRLWLYVEVAAEQRRTGVGTALVQQLRKLMDEYGYYQESLRSYSFSGTTEAQRAREFIAQLRREPLREIAGEKVVIVRDYGTRIEYDLVAGAQRPIDLPEEDVLQWVTEQGSRVTLRPSGTEPKMKLYLGVRGRSLADSQERLAALEKAFDQLVQNGLGNK